MSDLPKTSSTSSNQVEYTDVSNENQASDQLEQKIDAQISKSIGEQQDGTLEEPNGAFPEAKNEPDNEEEPREPFPEESNEPVPIPDQEPIPEQPNEVEEAPIRRFFNRVNMMRAFNEMEPIAFNEMLADPEHNLHIDTSDDDEEDIDEGSL